ncbi:MAG: hypothetical protein ACO398_10800, partial [Kiritimatiellia bacterium]
AGSLARNVSAGGETATMDEADKSASALPAATKDKPFTNSLGMQFVPVPGTDLSPVIRSPGTRLDRPGVLLEFVCENREGVTFHTREYRAFRSERFLYSVWGREGGMVPWQFYDLEADPGQLHNRVQDPACEEEIRQHHHWLCERMTATGDTARLAEAWGIPALNPCPDVN